MPDVVNIKNGESITLTIDGKKIKIDSNLTEDEIKSITVDHINSLMAYSAGFPKLFTASREYIIPITGKYRVTAVGGGGGGSAYYNNNWTTEWYKGKNGGDTKLIFNDKTYIAKGGEAGGINNNFLMPQKRFNGTSGSTYGGYGVTNGENGYGESGINIRHPNSTEFMYGGGAGSPFNFNANKIYQDEFVHNLYSSNPGYGYGAGGRSWGNKYIDNSIYGPGGGCSGELFVEELLLNKGQKLKIIIGAGGNGGYGSLSVLASNGAVLFEWLGNS